MGGIIKGAFGGGGGKKGGGYQSPYTAEMDKQLKERLSSTLKAAPDVPFSAFGGRTPGFGGTEWGFGNKALTTPYQGAKFSLGAYNPSQYQASQFTMPTALDQKTGAFGQLLGQTGREMLRQGRGALGEATRQAQLTGTASPMALAQMARESQQRGQEAVSDMGAKGAYDIASEQARYQADMQKSQAAENYLAAGYNRDEARYMAERDQDLQTRQAEENRLAQATNIAGIEAAQRGEQVAGQMSLQDTQQQQAYLNSLMDQVRQSYISPYATPVQPKTPSPFAQAFGSTLGAGVGGAASKLI